MGFSQGWNVASGGDDGSSIKEISVTNEQEFVQVFLDYNGNSGIVSKKGAIIWISNEISLTQNWELDHYNIYVFGNRNNIKFNTFTISVTAGEWNYKNVKFVYVDNNTSPFKLIGDGQLGLRKFISEDNLWLALFKSGSEAIISHEIDDTHYGFDYIIKGNTNYCNENPAQIPNDFKINFTKVVPQITVNIIDEVHLEGGKFSNKYVISGSTTLLASTVMTDGSAVVTSVPSGYTILDSRFDANKDVNSVSSENEVVTQNTTTKEVEVIKIKDFRFGANQINSGTLDGDRLPSMSATKLGGVPATGTPSGKVLSDGGTWIRLSSGYTFALYVGGTNLIHDMVETAYTYSLANSNCHVAVVVYGGGADYLENHVDRIKIHPNITIHYIGKPNVIRTATNELYDWDSTCEFNVFGNAVYTCLYGVVFCDYTTKNYYHEYYSAVCNNTSYACVYIRGGYDVINKCVFSSSASAYGIIIYAGQDANYLGAVLEGRYTGLLGNKVYTNGYASNDLSNSIFISTNSSYNALLFNGGLSQSTYIGSIIGKADISLIGIGIINIGAILGVATITLGACGGVVNIGCAFSINVLDTNQWNSGVVTVGEMSWHLIAGNYTRVKVDYLVNGSISCGIGSKLEIGNYHPYYDSGFTSQEFSEVHINTLKLSSAINFIAIRLNSLVIIENLYANSNISYLTLGNAGKVRLINTHIGASRTETVPIVSLNGVIIEMCNSNFRSLVPASGTNNYPLFKLLTHTTIISKGDTSIVFADTSGNTKWLDLNGFTATVQNEGNIRSNIDKSAGTYTETIVGGGTYTGNIAGLI